MAHRGRPSRAGPQRSIRGGIGRRPEPIVEPRVTPQGPWGMAHGGKVELFQDQVMRKFGGGSIKAKKSGGKIKTKKK